MRDIMLLVGLLTWSVLSSDGRAQTLQSAPRDLTTLSPEELTQVEVYSPAKRLEKLFETPAAISLVTQDDIRRSGANSIPEALRLVSGLDVAQSGQQHAISARGFNDNFANKLLVLQDGRSVYTPLFSGVFWDVQDPLLEDVQRIEVIRGPGASLWGANAVNGVVNITTKSTKETQGFLATGGGGTQERGFGGA
jgi:iron complex outermembrane receptor protein